MTTFSHTDVSSTEWPFPCAEDDWHQTPPSVQQDVMALEQQFSALQRQVDQLQKQVEILQGRIDKTSNTSSKPPSSDSPFTRPKRSKRRKSSGTRGARKGHPGSGPTLLEPTDVQHLSPAPCSCGHSEMGTPTLYHTHQRIELPPIAMQITHFLLHQARCVGCGRLIKAEVPSAYATGYGPRLSGRIGALSGMHGTSRRLIQNFCHSVLRMPISLGASKRSSTAFPAPSCLIMSPSPSQLATPPWALLMKPRGVANTPCSGSGP